MTALYQYTVRVLQRMSGSTAVQYITTNPQTIQALEWFGTDNNCYEGE